MRVKKISRYFKPSSCVYQYRGQIYLEKPLFTKIKYLYKDAELGFVAVTRRSVYWFETVIILILLAVFQFVSRLSKTEYLLQHPRMMTVRSDNTVVVDINNPISNIYPLSFEIRFEDGSRTESITLLPGTSARTVSLPGPLEEKDYLAKLVYTLRNHSREITKSFDVVIKAQNQQKY